MIEQSKIYVAGHLDMVSSTAVQERKARGRKNILIRIHAELESIDQSQARDFFEMEKPNKVYLCAAKIGNIHDNNTLSDEFIYENLMSSRYLEKSVR